MKHVLTIAGSDCSGGAGIQADLKTFAAHGTFGMSVITAVVAENTQRVISIQNVEPRVITDQIHAVFEDIPVDAVKVGMLSNASTMHAVVQALQQYRPDKLVVDPVMVAKGGCALMEESALETLIRVVLPMTLLLTPNIPEAECIASMKITNLEGMKWAAQKICDMGAKHVLVKGGHSAGDADDLLFDGSEFYLFSTKRIPTKNTHGTGCTFSAAIAANLAKGQNVQDAVSGAKRYITMAIEHALPIGKGHGPTHHFYELYQAGGMNDEI